jgi:hypothetical protein
MHGVLICELSANDATTASEPGGMAMSENGARIETGIATIVTDSGECLRR